MKRKTKIKQIALTITLIYLFSSNLMMVGAEGHLLSHERHGNHAARHATSICAWMCVASAYVHSPDQNIEQRFHPFSKSPTVSIESVSNGLSIFSFHIRPPPALLHR